MVRNRREKREVEEHEEKIWMMMDRRRVETAIMSVDHSPITLIVGVAEDRKGRRRWYRWFTIKICVCEEIQRCRWW